MRIKDAPSARSPANTTIDPALSTGSVTTPTTNANASLTQTAPAASHAASMAGWGAWVAALAPRGPVHFLEPHDVEAAMLSLQERGVDVSQIGSSREGRAIYAGKVGHGPIVLSVMAAAHPDEPTGTLTALHLLERLGTDKRFAPLLDKITLHVVPQANPDGAARNAPWFSSWKSEAPDLAAYFRHVARDLPKDDVEFGFADTPPAAVRPENAALGAWLAGIGAIDHHASLHSMFLGGGALFLVTSADLQPHKGTLRFLLGEADAVGMPLHDKDRMGQKGFFRIGPGLQTAPTAEAMRAFFAGQPSAQSFLLNSMQSVAKNNACPFSLVSEIPLVYDPRISSMAPTGTSRVEAETKLADGLLEMADRVGALAEGLPGIQERLTSMRNAAIAQKSDLARWGDAPATEGVLVENDLNLLRREATFLAAIDSERPGTAADALAAIIDQIRDGFDLRFPPIEVQMRLQIASVLAGALGTPAPAPNQRSRS